MRFSRLWMLYTRTEAELYLPTYFYYFNNIITCDPKGSRPPPSERDKLIASVTRMRLLQCPSVYRTNTIYNIPLGGVYNIISPRDCLLLVLSHWPVC